MSEYGIGKTGQMLHEKLANHLAGPFPMFLPQPWVTEILDQLGHRFRMVAFSPLGDGMGFHRSGLGPGSVV